MSDDQPVDPDAKDRARAAGGGMYGLRDQRGPVVRCNSCGATVQGEAGTTPPEKEALAGWTCSVCGKQGASLVGVR